MSTTPAATTPLTDEQVAKHCKFNQPFQHIAPLAVGNVLQGAAQAVPLHFNEVTITAAGVEPMVPASFARDLERALSSAQEELARVRMIPVDTDMLQAGVQEYRTCHDQPHLSIDTTVIRIFNRMLQANIDAALTAAPASDTQGSN